MQKEMPFLAEAPKLVFLEESLIKSCKDEHEALNLCFNRRTVRYSMTTLAAMLGLDQGRLSCILSGTKHMPARRRVMFMKYCGNAAPLQFEAMKLGISIKLETAEQRADRLQKEVDELKKKISKAA